MVFSKISVENSFSLSDFSSFVVWLTLRPGQASSWEAKERIMKTLAASCTLYKHSFSDLLMQVSVNVIKWIVTLDKYYISPTS